MTSTMATLPLDAVRRDLTLLRDYVANSGRHEGTCDADGPSGSCSVHVKTFNAKRARALEALTRLEEAVA